ncbi:hypothetical protein AMTRI_Chr08g164710 [Amborella trichopoda]
MIPTGWDSFSSQVRGRAGYRLQTKIQHLKTSLKTWSKAIPRNYSQTKSTLLDTIQGLDNLEESRPLDTSELNLRAQSKLEYLSTLKKEEIYWFQRSRIKWLKVGDQNTAFFHRIANCRRRDNTIAMLKVNNSYLTQPALIEQTIIEFFQTLYTAPTSPRPIMADLDFLALPSDLATWLEQPFTKDEIVQALNALANDKAPCPNGFPIAPFKILWSTFRPNFMEFFEKFFHRGILHKAINATFIALVPKVEGAKEIKDFYPISLLNSTYKILAKVLASRLQQGLPSVISPSQSAFIQDRQILDGVLVANECLHKAFSQETMPNLQNRLGESL